MMTLALHQGQWCQLENGNNAIVTRATTLLWIKSNEPIVVRAKTPAWQWQGCLRIEDGINTIVMRATNLIATMANTPAYWWKWHHHNKGYDASLTTSNKGNDTSSTMAETPAHQWWQWLIMMRATIIITTTAKMPAHWQWQRHHKKGNNASLMTSNEHTQSIGTMLESVQLPLSWPSQQGKEGLDKGNCTDYSVTPNNCVCHWTGWVEVASPPEGERATLAILVWPQTLACHFLWHFCMLEVVTKSGRTLSATWLLNALMEDLWDGDDNMIYINFISRYYELCSVLIA